jgi:hypothetical protein
MDQSPDGVFASALAVVVVISEEMGANTVTIVMANRATLCVRLFGIDVPESRQGEHFPGQPYGPEAMAYLQGLVQGQRVRVEIYGVDGHHRLFGTLFIDERNVNLVMVEVGLAEMYRDPGPRDPYQAQYEAAQATARRQARHVDPGGSVREPARLPPADQAQPIDKRLTRHPAFASPAFKHRLIGSLPDQRVGQQIRRLRQFSPWSR